MVLLFCNQIDLFILFNTAYLYKKKDCFFKNKTNKTKKQNNSQLNLSKWL